MTIDGNKLRHKDGTAEVQSDGEIVWWMDGGAYASRKEDSGDDKKKESSGHVENFTGFYFAFKTGGNPDDVADRWEIRQEKGSNKLGIFRLGRHECDFFVDGNRITGPFGLNV